MATSGPSIGLLAHPNVSATADVHEFSFIEGDVSVGAGAMVAPGTAITASAGASVVVGEGCLLLPGVVVEGVDGPQVMSKAGASASVWVGDRTLISHKCVIHSPAFIGADSFIGFRSTVFNARIGDGCVVMMHTLVQDVEVPAGKCVPSGSVITTQHQADQLPNVRPEDLEFAKEIMGGRSASSSRSQQTSGGRRQSQAKLIPIRGRSGQSSASRSGGSRASSSLNSPSPNRSSYSYATKGANKGAAMQTQRLSPEIVQQVRQFLGQGYRIGMEHADERRYRSGVWETCTPIRETREQAVFEALERCLAEHSGEYVRMFGIDPQAKRRVGMSTVQRPGDKPKGSSVQSASSGSYGGSRQSNRQSSGYSNGQNSSNSNGGGLTADVVQQVRGLLQSGFIIGTEHADARRYTSNVWKSCSPIKSTNESEVIAHLEHCLAEHSGEYVRMFGIDPKAKRRVSSATIQRADGKPVDSSGSASGAQSYGNQSYSNQSYSSSSYGGAQSSGYAQSDDGGTVAKAVNQILGQGNQIGVEYADARRYRSGIWQTAPSVSSLNQLQGFLSQHADKYVRVFGINKSQKTRGSSQTVQKPGQKQEIQPSQQGGSQNRRDPINANPPHYDDPAFRNQPSSYSTNSYSSYRAGGSSGSGNGSGNGDGIDARVLDQVTQIVNQGLKISIEFADKRRYRSGLWKTGAAINARRPAEAISEVGKQLARHKDDYVRLVGIDAKAKRRVTEVTIQKPGQAAQGVSGTGKDPINANPPHYDDPAFRGQPSSYSTNSYSSYRAGGNGTGNGTGNNGGMDANVLDQITQLVNQGHKISIEFADKRRFRSGIWKDGEAISARRPAEAISELGKQLARHQGEYVRLVGVDTQAKRRVLEATIQRP